MRTVAFISLVFLSTLLPWYVLLLFVIAYSLYWSGYELIILAIAIDAYFGVAHAVPYYTTAAVSLLVVIEWIKPKLLIYTM